MAATSPEAIARQKARKQAYRKSPEIRERARLRRIELKAQKRAAGLLPEKKIGRPKGSTGTKRHKQKAMTINPSQNAPVQIPKQPKAKWADMPAIVPPGVKKQVLPGCPTRSRYEPPQHFRGEYTNEWKQLTRG